MASTKVSKFARMVDIESLSGDQKGRLSEDVVVNRLFAVGCVPFVRASGIQRFDILVYTPKSDEVLRIQVKTVGRGYIKITGHEGEYTRECFDYIVGYDIATDSAYVYSFEETRNHGTILTVDTSALEMWTKITDRDLNATLKRFLRSARHVGVGLDSVKQNIMSMIASYEEEEKQALEEEIARRKKKADRDVAVLEARRLRREKKLSTAEIARKLNRNYRTVGYWLRDLPLTPKQITKARLRSVRANQISRETRER